MMPVILTIFSALITSFSNSGLNIWLPAWFGLIPLFFALDNQPAARAFLTAFLWGFIFWLSSVYWLGHITFLGVFILILYLSVYCGVFGFFVVFANRLAFIYRMFFIPAIWVLLEYLRSNLFTGFPWVILGYTQSSNLWVIQIADIFGSWGVSFLIVLVNYVFYLFLQKKNRACHLRVFGVPILILLACLSYGVYKLSAFSSSAQAVKSSPKIRVSVVQANIPQALKWDPRARGYIMSVYAGLTFRAALDKPDLIVWPEASAPGLFDEALNPARQQESGEDEKLFQDLFRLAKESNSRLLAGAVSCQGGHYFNSALLIGRQGGLKGIYHKLHLVPFGEYIPFKKIFPFLEAVVPIGDINPGSDYVVFGHPAKFSVLICFEDLFPGLSREFVRKGARFLVNITNDAWYKQTSAPFQHFSSAVFRAVENRVYLVRAANTGVSAFINPAGRVESRVETSGKLIFVPGFRSQDISLAGPAPTFYNRYGDIFVLACFVFALFTAGGLFKRPAARSG